MKSFVFFILLLISISATAQTATQQLVHVEPGDLAALKQAMEAANDENPDFKTEIWTEGTFSFTNEESGLPEVRSHVIIRGHGDPITFAGAGETFGNLLMVQKEGWLQLFNIEIKDFSLDLERDAQGTYIDQSLLINHGKLEFSQVQIDALEARSIWSKYIRAAYAPIITNSASGQLYLNQASLINSGTAQAGGVIFNDGIVEMKNTQVYYSREEAAPFRNNRYMSMTNISMFQSLNNGSSPVLTLPEAETYMSNSVISGFSGDFCLSVTSLGHNLIDNDQCSFNAEGDINRGPAGLSWRPVETVPSENWMHSSLPSLLTHALVPFATSPAVDSIDTELCPVDHLLKWDGRGADGNADGVGKCDRGAFELQPVHLVNGGINGVYYDPDADGHFISIIDNDYNTLIMWNSFDKNGNQYFVSGTGELVLGRSLTADAYTTVSGGTSPDGTILPAQAIHWGTLVLDMISCNEGSMAFHSDLPEFGSGQVQLVRLAYVKQLGCVD